MKIISTQIAKVGPSPPSPPFSPPSPISSSASQRSSRVFAFSAIVKQRSNAAQRNVEAAFGATIGTLLAVIFTVVVSYADVTSDIAVLSTWHLQEDRQDFANALLSTMCFAVTLQLMFTVYQNHKKALKEQAVETLLVLFMLAPAVLAFRAYSGKKQASSDLISHKLMHVVLKSVEIAFEAVIGLLIQLLAILSSPDTVTTTQLVSVAVSVLAIAFGVASMFHDKDVHPENRKRNPTFYGTLPSHPPRRWAAMAALLVFSMCHVFCKCLGLTLLWTTFGGYDAGGFWLCDFLLYCLIKIAQGDFVYWMPAESTSVTLLISTLLRLAQKTLVDFTGFVQFRYVVRFPI